MGRLKLFGITAVLAVFNIFSTNLHASLDEFAEPSGILGFVGRIAYFHKDIEIGKFGYGSVSRNSGRSTRPYFWEAVSLNIFLSQNISFCFSPFNSAYFKTDIPAEHYTNSQKNTDSLGNESINTETIYSRASSFSKYYVPLHIRYYLPSFTSRAGIYTGLGAGRFVYKRDLEIQHYGNVSFESFNVEKEKITPCLSMGVFYSYKKFGFALESRAFKSYFESKGVVHFISAVVSYKLN